jgi:ATP-dependent DNA helicase DinG
MQEIDSQPEVLDLPEDADKVIPLTENEKFLVGSVYGAFKAQFPDFKVRKQQKTMIGEVANVFAKGSIGLVEAPTGTGKSASYLLPGGVLAITREKKLIVSTATASLQDQLAKKDAPLIVAALKSAGLGDVRYAVAKGRERHLCISKLMALTEQGTLFDESDDKEGLLEVAKAWNGGLWDGIRDSLPNGVKPVIWAKVANKRDTCPGGTCPDAKECPYNRSLKDIDESKIIITNHDYLLACMVNNPNHALSKTGDNIYVFDEGHHLGKKCLSVFSRAINFEPEYFIQVINAMEMMGESTARIAMAIERCNSTNRTLADHAKKLIGNNSIYRFPYGTVPDEYLDSILRYHLAAQNTLEQLDTAITNYRERAGLGPMTQIVRLRVSTIRTELSAVVDSLDAFLSEDQEKARWIQKSSKKFELMCSPFDSSILARKFLWTRIKTAVLTSATFGDIKATVRSLGLPTSTRTLKLDSPLDYSNCQFVVPQLATQGTDAGHIEMTQCLINQSAYMSPDKGVLVYFTSRKHMNAVYSALSKPEQAMTLLQGDVTPSEMLKLHKERVDRGEKSVMFGLDSLSEGIDLPGQYCSIVLVSKLPFPSPDDPILATHCEVLLRRGHNPFNLIVLPETLIKLSQVVGRLNRREGDWGSVIVLDGRMVTKRYGSQLLKGTAFTAIERYTRPMAITA